MQELCLRQSASRLMPQDIPIPCTILSAVLPAMRTPSSLRRHMAISL